MFRPPLSSNRMNREKILLYNLHFRSHNVTANNAIWTILPPANLHDGNLIVDSAQVTLNKSAVRTMGPGGCDQKVSRFLVPGTLFQRLFSLLRENVARVQPACVHTLHGNRQDTRFKKKNPPRHGVPASFILMKWLRPFVGYLK